MNRIKFKKLCGKHILTGVERDYVKNSDAECLKFILDGKVYTAFEDPDDGYRSMCSGIEISNGKCLSNIPPTEVLCRYEDNEEKKILHFHDTTTGGEVLGIGTDYTEDYYPVCILRYSPENLSCNSRKAKRTRRS